ncbi:hypothetical protein J3A83DRAFT_4188931 [Scleroderma citrinum]
MPCDGNDEESHGHDADQAKHNAEGPASEKGGKGSGLNEEGIDDGMQMEFGNDNEPCFCPIQFEDCDNPPMDCDELFHGDMQMLSPHWGQKALLMNYVIRNKEMALQQDEMLFNCENAEAEFRCQEGLKKLEIDLKLIKENVYSKQIKALQLQVWLAELQGSKQPSSSSGPSSFN